MKIVLENGVSDRPLRIHRAWYETCDYFGATMDLFGLHMALWMLAGLTTGWVVSHLYGLDSR